MGILQKKRRARMKNAPAYRGKGGQNAGTAFPALRLGVVLYPLKFGRHAKELRNRPLPLSDDCIEVLQNKCFGGDGRGAFCARRRTC